MQGTESTLRHSARISHGCPSTASVPELSHNSKLVLFLRKMYTYPLVPRIPEPADANVEPDAEGECASKDGRHVNACAPCG